MTATEENKLHDKTRGWPDRKEGETWKTGSEATRQRRSDYLEWLLTPASLREPSLKQDFAKHLNITVQALHAYSKDPLFQKELARRMAELGRVERAPEVMDSLFRQSIDTENSRSVSAAKIWLEHTYKYMDASAEAIPVDDMNDDDLAKLAWSILEKISDTDGEA